MLKVKSFNDLLVFAVLLLFSFLFTNKSFGQTTSLTYEDQFNTVSYANDDGVINFASNWTEDDDDDPSGGRVTISGSELRFRNLDDRSIYRFLDLSWVPTSSTVTLTFDYDATARAGEVLDVLLFNPNAPSIPGIGTYDIIESLDTNSSGTITYILSADQISTDSEIWFISVNDTSWGGSDEIFIDNVKFTVTDTEQDPCASVPASITNPDGDSVSEICTATFDLDEDNDGILDINELGTCATSGSVLDWSANYTSGGAAAETGDDPVVVNPTATADGVNVYLSRTVSGVIEGYTYKINNFNSTGIYNLLQEAKNGGASTHTFKFSQPVYNLAFTVFDVDEGGGNTTFIDEVEIIITKEDGTTHALTAGEYTTNGQTFTSNTFTGTGASTDASFSINGIQAWVSKIDIVYSNLTTAPVSGQNQGTGISDFTFCKAQDTDTDGTPDYLDIDSDNDGCYDAIEAAGSFTASDLTSSNNLADADEGSVDSNGIPTNSGSPQATTTNVTTVNAAPNAGTISGPTSLCIGNTITLSSDGDIGGEWTSSNTSVATVNISTGEVLGVANGSVTLTYTVT